MVPMVSGYVIVFDYLIAPSERVWKGMHGGEVQEGDGLELERWAGWCTVEACSGRNAHMHDSHDVLRVSQCAIATLE